MSSRHSARAPRKRRACAAGDDGLQVIAVKFRSAADRLGVGQGSVMTRAEVAKPRPSKHWMLLPAYLLLGRLATWQLRRARASASSAPVLA